MPTQSENQTQAYSTFVTTSPAAVTSTTAVAAGLASGPGSSLVNLVAGYAPGVSTIALDSTSSFFVGENVLIDSGGAKAEICTIKSISSPNLTFINPTVFAHADEATVVGMYAGITPMNSGRLKIMVSGSLLAGSTAATVTAQLYIGSAVTVAAPANAAAFDASAVAVGNTGNWVSLTGALETPITLVAFLGANSSSTDTAPSGGAARTLAVPYYIDVGLTASTGTIQLVKPSIVITEES